MTGYGHCRRRGGIDAAGVAGSETEHSFLRKPYREVSRLHVNRGVGSQAKPMFLAALAKSRIGRISRRSRHLQRRGYRQGQVAGSRNRADYGARYPKAIAKIVDDAECSGVLQVPAGDGIH